jgi:hypothetical protein
MKYLLLTNCFGFIDGLNLPVHVADDEEWVEMMSLFCCLLLTNIWV